MRHAQGVAAEHGRNAAAVHRSDRHAPDRPRRGAEQGERPRRGDDADGPSQIGKAVPAVRKAPPAHLPSAVKQNAGKYVPAHGAVPPEGARGDVHGSGECTDQTKKEQGRNAPYADRPVRSRPRIGIQGSHQPAQREGQRIEGKNGGGILLRPSRVRRNEDECRADAQFHGDARPFRKPQERIHDGERRARPAAEQQPPRPHAQAGAPDTQIEQHDVGEQVPEKGIFPIDRHRPPPRSAWGNYTMPRRAFLHKMCRGTSNARRYVCRCAGIFSLPPCQALNCMLYCKRA